LLQQRITSLAQQMFAPKKTNDQLLDSVQNEQNSVLDSNMATLGSHETGVKMHSGSEMPKMSTQNTYTEKMFSSSETVPMATKTNTPTPDEPEAYDDPWWKKITLESKQTLFQIAKSIKAEFGLEYRVMKIVRIIGLKNGIKDTDKVSKGTEILIPKEKYFIDNEEKLKDSEFKDLVDGRTYQQDIIDQLTKEIDAGAEADKLELEQEQLEWQSVEEIGNTAKEIVDDMFGGYTSDMAEFKYGKSGVEDPTIIDLGSYEPTDEELDSFLRAYLLAHSFQEAIYTDKTIHEVHGAKTDDDEEYQITTEAIHELLSNPDMRQKIINLHKTWPGKHRHGLIFIQRFMPESDEAKRAQRWDLFHTFIHEYIHSFEDGKYSIFRKKTGADTNKILTEGATSYFSNKVWKSVFPDKVKDDAEFRAKIEGSELPYEDSVVPEDIQDGYKEARELFEGNWVDVHTYDIMKEAFFKGEIEALTSDD